MNSKEKDIEKKEELPIDFIKIEEEGEYTPFNWFFI